MYSQAEWNCVFLLTQAVHEHSVVVFFCVLYIHQSNSPTRAKDSRQHCVLPSPRPPKVLLFIVALGTLTLQNICLNCLVLFMIDWYLKYLLCCVQFETSVRFLFTFFSKQNSNFYNEHNYQEPD